MAYTLKDWRNRLSERTDLTAKLVHLTRRTPTLSSLDVLLKILQNKKLLGSTTATGYIVGKRPAVCLQDAPLYAVGQNLYFESKARQANQTTPRYSPCGLSFPKEMIFRKGGRPVFYGPTDELKRTVSETDWWRIVNLDLTVDDSVIDWTHEREWRVPDELTFELSDVVVLLSGPDDYREFIRKASAIEGDILTKLRGIVSLGTVFL